MSKELEQRDIEQQQREEYAGEGEKMQEKDPLLFKTKECLGGASFFFREMMLTIQQNSLSLSEPVERSGSTSPLNGFIVTLGKSSD